ncbi:MAG: DUF2325 domain-containing protein, partial [Pseudanabaena sp.]
MHISELDELEASVSDLLTMAKVELEQNRLQQQRERQIQEAVAQIEGRLKPLLAKVEQMLEEYNREGGTPDSETKLRLEKKAADIRQEIAEAPTLA